MSLIKVKDLGFGLSGTRVDITIALPKDKYLYSFRVYNQNDVRESGCSSSIGIDYIEFIMATEHCTREEAFHFLFGESIDQYIDPVTNKEYNVYKIGEGAVTGISQKDITFIEMELLEEAADNCSDTHLTVPLFNLTPMRLFALDLLKTSKEDCGIPMSFTDKLLQIKTIELAICCGDFCGAAKYWDKFYGKCVAKPVKKCGCHGGVV